LSESDIEAISRGYSERNQIIKEALLREICSIPDSIERDPLNFLSWMIANDYVEIKIAIPKVFSANNYGIYHEKTGLFIDKSNNLVAFSGSNNETESAVAYNYESFDVFCSWVDLERCKNKYDHFLELWNDNAKGVDVFEFPQAVRDKLIDKIKPDPCPERCYQHLSAVINKKNSVKEYYQSLWDFQKEALQKWKENSYCGILSMATGTGKTRTAISGLLKLSNSYDNL